MNEAEHVRRIRPINVLVALACIVAVFALVLPAIHTSSRHTQGRIDCANNLKNVALGLQNYCDTYGVYPTGATHAGSRESPRIGPSWWYAIHPFMEQYRYHGLISGTQEKGFEPAGIEFLRVDGEPVPRLIPDQSIPIGSQCSSQLRELYVHRISGRIRNVPRPEIFDQPIDGHGFAGVDDESGKNGPLARWPQFDFAVVSVHLEWPEDPHIHLYPSPVARRLLIGGVGRPGGVGM